MTALLVTLLALLVLALLLLTGISASLHRLATHHERFPPPDLELRTYPTDSVTATGREIGYLEGEHVTLRYAGLEHRAVVLADDGLGELTLELLPSAWTNEREEGEQ